MRKAVLGGLALTLSVSMALTGCGSKQNPGDGNKPGTAAEGNSAVSKAGTFPIVKDKQTLKVFTAHDTFVENYETNDFTKWYEEKTNLHVEWEAVPSSAAKEKLQVKLATADLPDIFMNAGLTESQMVMFGTQGVFVPLNGLIDKYAPNVKNMLDKQSEAALRAYTPDGNIYALPSVNESAQQSYPKKMWINKPWLDKLGLSMPETTEEFYQVLKAFKTKDPNGNGKADEVPMAACNGDKNANNELESFLMMSYTFYDRSNYLMMDGDKVKFIGDTQEYKDGLKYLRKLYSEDLIAKDSFIQDRKALMALTENDTVNKLGAAPSYALGHFTIDAGSTTNRFKDFVNVPPLKGPTGLRQAFDRGAQVLVGRFAITRNSKIPEAAIRWIDWFYDNEGMLNSEYHAGLGKEGTGWKKAAEGAKALDGSAAKIERIIPSGTKTNHHWSLTYPTYESLDYLMKIAATQEKDIIVYSEAKTKYAPYAVNKAVSFMFLTEEQLAKSGDLKTSIKKVADTFQVKFITGTLDIDKDWDAYVKELKNAKLDEFVKVTQEAYDASKKAKK